MPKKQITTSRDIRFAFQKIIEILCDIQYEECSSLLEDCLRDRAKMNNLDVDISESEEEQEQEEEIEDIVDNEDFDIDNELW
jgi:hypothetical protein